MAETPILSTIKLGQTTAEDDASIQIKNNYYMSKIFIRTDLHEAHKRFKEIYQSLPGKSLLGFKVLKQLLKCTSSQPEVNLEYFSKILDYYDGGVSRSAFEKFVLDWLNAFSQNPNSQHLSAYCFKIAERIPKGLYYPIDITNNVNLCAFYFDNGQDEELCKVLPDFKATCQVSATLNQTENYSHYDEIKSRFLAKLVCFEHDCYLRKFDYFSFKNVLLPYFESIEKSNIKQLAGLMQETLGLLALWERDLQEALKRLSQAYYFYTMNDPNARLKGVICYLSAVSCLTSVAFTEDLYNKLEKHLDEPDFAPLSNLLKEVSTLHTLNADLTVDNYVKLSGRTFLGKCIKEFINMKRIEKLKLLERDCAFSYPELARELSCSVEDVEKIVMLAYHLEEPIFYIDQLNEIVVIRQISEASIAMSPQKSASESGTTPVSND